MRPARLRIGLSTGRRRGPQSAFVCLCRIPLRAGYSDRSELPGTFALLMALYPGNEQPSSIEVSHRAAQRLPAEFVAEWKSAPSKAACRTDHIAGPGVLAPA